MYRIAKVLIQPVYRDMIQIHSWDWLDNEHGEYWVLSQSAEYARPTSPLVIHTDWCINTFENIQENVWQINQLNQKNGKNTRQPFDEYIISDGFKSNFTCFVLANKMYSLNIHCAIKYMYLF